MDTPLLAAKLSPPPLFATVINRSDLIARLATAHARLTLIVAPPGFGKTTLLISWLAGRAAETTLTPNLRPPVACAWLSIDVRDNDPTRFWSALPAALARAFPGLGDHARSMLQSPQPPSLDVVVSALIEDLAALQDPCLLVLDDYHLIADPDIHSGLALLIEHLPPQIRLVILSRSEPPLPLARLRVRGQLSELRATDLRFSPSESAAFLHAHGLSLAPDELAELA
ncbi:MAG: AAA family ATPase, partial [Oscillochloris sp.]|nr:AAA family ATPase [Oscillochloris sp.]